MTGERDRGVDWRRELGPVSILPWASSMAVETSGQLVCHVGESRRQENTREGRVVSRT